MLFLYFFFIHCCVSNEERLYKHQQLTGDFYFSFSLSFSYLTFIFMSFGWINEENLNAIHMISPSQLLIHSQNRTHRKCYQLSTLKTLRAVVMTFFQRNKEVFYIVVKAMVYNKCCQVIGIMEFKNVWHSQPFTALSAIKLPKDSSSSYYNTYSYCCNMDKCNLGKVKLQAMPGIFYVGIHIHFLASLSVRPFCLLLLRYSYNLNFYS